MEVYNPSGFNLPPIMIEKRKYRINIEKDQTVKNFINTKLLLNNDFNKLYSDILQRSKEVMSYFSLKEDDIYRKFFPFRRKNISKSSFSYRDLLLFDRYLLHGIKSTSDEKTKGLILKIRKEFFKEIKNKLKTFNRKIENSVSSFEQKTGIDLNILSSTSVYFCKNCNKYYL